MDMHLTFARGSIAGEGNDDIGVFFIRGKYDTSTKECHWTKSYPGSHDVFYRGFREGKGIWGKWELDSMSGGFHIWPEVKKRAIWKHRSKKRQNRLKRLAFTNPHQSRKQALAPCFLIKSFEFKTKILGRQEDFES